MNYLETIFIYILKGKNKDNSKMNMFFSVHVHIFHLEKNSDGIWWNVTPIQKHATQN